MNRFLITRFALIFAALLCVFSCDSDYSEVGTNILGNQNYTLQGTPYGITASTLGQGPVLSKNLPINPLGIYNNPVFGKTTASFVTQVELATADVNSSLLDEATVESVQLLIPYFSTANGTNFEGEPQYLLDSVYVPGGKLDLKVWENGYFIRDNDASSTVQQAQKYYTDEQSLFENSKRGVLLPDSTVQTQLNNSLDADQNSSFFYKATEVQQFGVSNLGVLETTKVSPRMQLMLDKDYFQQRIFSAVGRTKVLNNNIFKEYFRGLYFEVGQSLSTPETTLAMLNFAAGEIRIVYKGRNSTDDLTTVRYRTLTLRLVGNSVSLQQNDYNSNYLQSLGQSPANTDRLFIKGGAGSTAYINLFKDDELANLRAQNVLVNEANIVFTVDQNALSSVPARLEPTRIYLFDAESKRPIVDYYADASVNASNPKYSKSVFGGILERTSGTTGKGVRYKIKITNYIRQLVGTDSINRKLGLVVTEDIGLIQNATLKNPASDMFDRIPVGSVINPFGTVLYGSGNNVSEDQKVKFEIYYTKSK